MKTSDFYYELPQELIAQTPAKERDQARLLAYDRASGEMRDDVFKNITQYLRPTDVLVRNTTKVIPARLHAQRESTGGKMEFLLLKPLEGDRWECLARPGRRARVSDIFAVSDELRVRVEGRTEDGNCIVTLLYDGILQEILDRVGEVPLPPYIKCMADRDRYQTVYAKQRGSAAAPTAGFHFTPQLLDEIERMGVKIVDVLLHVGLGTFRPVSAETVEEHVMHAEYYEVSEAAAARINAGRERGGRIVCVGTTSCRTLESVTDEKGIVHAGSGWTNIFITPGYRFRAVDALITNFHLPESTLLMLVSALCGREEILRLYHHAVEERYRFFSFGDAMFIA